MSKAVQQIPGPELCVLIPAFNEEQHLSETIKNIYESLYQYGIFHNILIINDHSTDGSLALLNQLKKTIPTLEFVNNAYDQGFGNTVRYGLDNWKGDVVAIVMADASDSPSDIVAYYRIFTTRRVDCVFGSRFKRGSVVKDYPVRKLIFNRFFNLVVRILVDYRYNDFTNAFKLYSREVIEACRPYQSQNFSLTLELPLKALSKGFSYTIIPINWTQRKYGRSKLNLWKNMKAYFGVLHLYKTKTL